MLKKIISLIIVFGFLGFDFVFSQQENIQELAKKHYQLGNIYYEHGLYQEAEKEFNQALIYAQGGGADSLTVFSPQNDFTAEELQFYNSALAQRRDKTKKSEPDNILSNKQPRNISSRQEYIIAVGDVLKITVWENPDLTQEVMVRPDGKISFPLLNDIFVEGLTISELDAVITEGLTQYIRLPDVAIALTKIGGQKVIILGEVNRPGIYAIEGKKTTVEAIALAGGFTRDAVLRSVIVIKGGFVNPQAKRINLSRALMGKKIKEDVELEAQDVVYVPKKFISNVTYVINQILDPISKGSNTYQSMTIW